MTELALLISGGVTIFIVSILIIWRNAVYEREALRHREMTKLLYGIYKAVERDH